MIVSHKYKFCYTGIPKTGSSSIHTFFRQIDDTEDFLIYDEHNFRPRFKSASVKHFRCKDILKYLSEEDKNPEEYKFLYTVRNPYSYAASDFFMMKKHHAGVIDTAKKYAEHATGNIKWVKKCKSFRDMLSTSKDDRSLFSTYLDEHYQTSSLYWPYVEGVTDSQLVQMKFESLQEDFSKQCQQLIGQNRDFTLGFRNVNRDKTESDYMELFDSKSRRRFYDQYRIDFVTYGYKEGWFTS